MGDTRGDNMKMVKLNVKITQEMQESIRKYASEQGISFSEAVRELIGVAFELST